MICYSNATYYYLLKLMFSTKQFKGITALGNNKNLYYTTLGEERYSVLATDKNKVSLAYLGVHPK